MGKYFTYKNFNTCRIFNNSDLAVLCEILERERERERERRRPCVTNHFFYKTKFPLCQNDGIVFLIYILLDFYTNLYKSWLGISCQTEIFCCHYCCLISVSDSPPYPDQLWAVKCRECTLLSFLTKKHTQFYNKERYRIKKIKLPNSKTHPQKEILYFATRVFLHYFCVRMTLYFFL